MTSKVPVKPPGINGSAPEKPVSGRVRGNVGAPVVRKSALCHTGCQEGSTRRAVRADSARGDVHRDILCGAFTRQAGQLTVQPGLAFWDLARCNNHVDFFSIFCELVQGNRNHRKSRVLEISPAQGGGDRGDIRQRWGWSPPHDSRSLPSSLSTFTALPITVSRNPSASKGAFQAPL